MYPSNDASGRLECNLDIRDNTNMYNQLAVYIYVHNIKVLQTIKIKIFNFHINKQ